MLTLRPVTNREIDALIAERLFSMKPCTVGHYEREYADRGDGIARQWCLGLRMRGETVITLDGRLIPNYSTDPVAAKLIREKLAERPERLLSLTLWRTESGVMEYSFSITDPEEFGLDLIATAKSEELAVCLCALKVIGIELEITEVK